MDAFIGRNYAEEPFEIFSKTHLFILSVIILLNFILVLWFKRAKRKKNGIAWFRKSLACLLIVLEILFTIWCIYVGDWSVDYALPLHLCDAAILVAAAMLLSRNRLIFEVSYFWVLGGCTQALLTPDVGFDYPHFMFFYFFIGHGAVITAVLYMVFSEGFRPYLSSIPRVLVLTNIYAGIVAVVDLVTGGNYLFLCHKPGNSSIMDFMGPWPWYIAVLELASVVVFFICYLPYLIGDLVDRRVAYFSNKHHRGMSA